MPVADDNYINFLMHSFSGFHFTLDQAEKLKKRIDLLTDRREFCPCSECREKKLPIRAGHN
jgi:hypothetical protein